MKNNVNQANPLLPHRHPAPPRRSPDGMRSSAPTPAQRPAFTLIEFILVMALLAVVMAFSAPSLARFFRQRHLEEEATRFVALTEYGRNEAASQGVPMVIWINPKLQKYGLEPKSGFLVASPRLRTYTLHEDVQFNLGKSRGSQNGVVEAAEFAPDGYLALDSLEEVWLTDRNGKEIVVAQTTNAWGYEILKPTDYALRRQTR